MGYPGGHQPDFGHCVVCGGPCAHKDLLLKPKRAPKIPSGDKPRRVVFYVPPDLYIALLKSAGGRDLSPWLNEILKANEYVMKHLEKEK